MILAARWEMRSWRRSPSSLLRCARQVDASIHGSLGSTGLHLPATCGGSATWTTTPSARVTAEQLVSSIWHTGPRFPREGLQLGRLRLALPDALRTIDAQLSLPDCSGPGQNRDGVSHGKEKRGDVPLAEAKPGVAAAHNPWITRYEFKAPEWMICARRAVPSRPAPAAQSRRYARMTADWPRGVRSPSVMTTAPSSQPPTGGSS